MSRPSLPHRHRCASPRTTQQSGPLFAALAAAALVLPAATGIWMAHRDRGDPVRSPRHWVDHSAVRLSESPSFAQLHYGYRLARNGTVSVEAMTSRYQRLLLQGLSAAIRAVPMFTPYSAMAGAARPL